MAVSYTYLDPSLFGHCPSNYGKLQRDLGWKELLQTSHDVKTALQLAQTYTLIAFFDLVNGRVDDLWMLMSLASGIAIQRKWHQLPVPGTEPTEEETATFWVVHILDQIVCMSVDKAPAFVQDSITRRIPCYTPAGRSTADFVYRHVKSLRLYNQVNSFTRSWQEDIKKGDTAIGHDKVMALLVEISALKSTIEMPESHSALDLEYLTCSATLNA